MDFRSWSNFECIWGHLGGCFNFGLFGTVFGPQKVLLLGKFSRLTSRSRGQGHLIRDKFWPRKFFFGVALLWYFSQGGIDKLCIKGYNWDPCYRAIGSAPKKKIFFQNIKKHLNFDIQLRNPWVACQYLLNFENTEI